MLNNKAHRSPLYDKSPEGNIILLYYALASDRINQVPRNRLKC